MVFINGLLVSGLWKRFAGGGEEVTDAPARSLHVISINNAMLFTHKSRFPAIESTVLILLIGAGFLFMI